jgi:predicted kinase
MEAVILCGIQGSGKSTFYVARYFDTHVRISQDLLRTRNRMRRMLELCLDTQMPFVVDRVNATPEQRAVFVRPARAAGFRTVACWLDTPPGVAVERNERRTGTARVPVQAILGTAKRFAPPTTAEGFDQVLRVTAGPDGFGLVDQSGQLVRPAVRRAADGRGAPEGS